MVAVLACGSPGIFRAAVGHSRGGLTAPTTCQPIPYLGSLGLSDVAGNSQATQTDPFAKWDGCAIADVAHRALRGPHLHALHRMYGGRSGDLVLIRRSPHRLAD